MSPEAIQTIMAAYSQHERKAAAPSTYKTERASGVTRHIAPSPFGSFIVDFDIADSNLEATIAREVARFSALHKSFEWKIFDTDRPTRIGEALVAQGFKKGEAEAFMVLDLTKTPDMWLAAAIPGIASVRRITDWAGVQDMAQVQNQVWGRDNAANAEAIWAEIQDPAETMTLYVAYVDGRPVSTARQTFVPGSPFSGLWGSSTLAAYRRMGCYSALLHARAADAIRRGIRYLTIDASDMSRPIVARAGFEFVTHTAPYEWSV